MKNIKWLITLADGKPLLFSVALLLLAVMALSAVVINKQNEVDNCYYQKLLDQREYSRRLDSISARYAQREIDLNSEVKNTLNLIILDYKSQLEEQKNINKLINNTLSKNKNLINTAKKTIETLNK